MKAYPVAGNRRLSRLVSDRRQKVLTENHQRRVSPGSLLRRLASSRFALPGRRSVCAAVGVSLIAASLSASAGDLSFVPLFDGERADALNLWGGPFTAGSGVSFAKQSAVVRSGAAAYRVDL